MALKTIFDSRLSNTFTHIRLDMKEYSFEAQAFIKTSIALAIAADCKIVIEGTKYDIYIKLFSAHGIFTGKAKNLFLSIVTLSEDFSIDKENEKHIITIKYIDL